MNLLCHHCKRTWLVPAGQFLAARLKFAFGQHEHTFICPNCQAENLVTEQKFLSSETQIPLTGTAPQARTVPKPHPPRADNDPASAPTNPVPGPDPNGRQVHAVVLEPGLRLLREHNPMSETMGTIHNGEHIIILNTWTDGKDVWIQLGPERWATIEDKGQPLIDLLNDASSASLKPD